MANKNNCILETLSHRLSSSNIHVHVTVGAQEVLCLCCSLLWSTKVEINLHLYNLHVFVCYCQTTKHFISELLAQRWV